MRNTHPVSITQPRNLAAMIKAPVTSDDHAAIENWLRDEVAKSHDEWMSNPDIGIPADKIMARLHTSFLVRQIKSAE